MKNFPAQKVAHAIVKWNPTGDFEPQTVPEHAKILARGDPKNAFVWWAKISKSGHIGLSAAQLRQLKRQLQCGVETHLYIYGPDQPHPTLHIGSLTAIVTRQPPEKEHIPFYYSKLVYPKSHWFRLSDLRQISLEHISNLTRTDGQQFDPVSANAYPLLVHERSLLTPFDYAETGGLRWFQLQHLSVVGQELINVNPKFVFVLMPFAQQFEDAWTLAIRPAVEKLGFTCRRADDFKHSQEIMEVVREQIRKAGLIIADMTGNNPNVFYELGYAHALGKSVILITRSRSKVPFDLRSVNNIEYCNATALKRDLGEMLRAMIRTGKEKGKWAQRSS